MKKTTFLIVTTLMSIIIISCSEEDITNQSIDSERRAYKTGWYCSPTMGPFYNMDLYNSGISVSSECRYLHIYDLDQEGDDGEVLHIGYWAIPPNATNISNIGLDGLHSCTSNRPSRDCSLLLDNTIYYFEVSTSNEPLSDVIDYGWLPQYYGECECN